MTDNYPIQFMDGGTVPLERSLEAALTEFEGSLDQTLDWDEGSVVMLGIVNVSSMIGMGVMEFRFLDIVPDGVSEDFMNGFPLMVDALLDDIRAGEENVKGLMRQLGGGFLGWVMVTQGWDVEERTPEGERLAVRMVGYYNTGTQGFWVARRPRGGEVECGWGRPDTDDGVYGALKVMTELSHFLRIRRDLIDQ